MIDRLIHTVLAKSVAPQLALNDILLNDPGNIFTIMRHPLLSVCKCCLKKLTTI